MGVWGEFLKKTEAFYAEVNERAEAATSSYSATDNFLRYIFFVPVTENHKKSNQGV